jgi:hypothetical protein
MRSGRSRSRSDRPEYILTFIPDFVIFILLVRLMRRTPPLGVIFDPDHRRAVLVNNQALAYEVAVKLQYLFNLKVVIHDFTPLSI